MHREPSNDEPAPVFLFQIPEGLAELAGSTFDRLLFSIDWGIAHRRSNVPPDTDLAAFHAWCQSARPEDVA